MEISLLELKEKELEIAEKVKAYLAFPEKHQKNLERIRRLRLIDDTFARVVFKDEKCTLLLLTILLGRKDLVIKSLTTQMDLKNLMGHSSIIDIVVETGDGDLFAVEVQRRDEGHLVERAEYEGGLLVANFLPSGFEYKDIKKTYIIYICEKDPFGYGEAIYYLERHLRGHGVISTKSPECLFVNGEYRGKDPQGLLMEDFFFTEPEKMHYDVLRKRAGYFKEENGGINTMCAIMEEVRDEEKASVVIRSYKYGDSLQKIADITELSVVKVQQILQKAGVEVKA